MAASDNLSPQQFPPPSKTYNREHWQPGQKAHFEYHCLESPESEDAPAWYRSHQKVHVLGEGTHDAPPGSTFGERAEIGQPKTYRVRFPDDFEHEAFEDELMTSRKGFARPDPPPMKEI